MRSSAPVSARRSLSTSRASTRRCLLDAFFGQAKQASEEPGPPHSSLVQGVSRDVIRGPACEQVDGFGRAAAGLGAEDGHEQAAVGGELHAFVVEVELADDRVVQALAAGLVVADVLGGPSLAERLAARGQLADEVADGSVVRVASGFGAQRGDQVLGGFLPSWRRTAVPRGPGKVKRAALAGCSRLSNSGAYSARPSALAVR